MKRSAFVNKTKPVEVKKPGKKKLQTPITEDTKESKASGIPDVKEEASEDKSK